MTLMIMHVLEIIIYYDDPELAGELPPILPNYMVFDEDELNKSNIEEGKW